MKRILCIGHIHSVCYVWKAFVKCPIHGKYEEIVIMTKSIGVVDIA